MLFWRNDHLLFHGIILCYFSEIALTIKTINNYAILQNQQGYLVQLACYLE